MRGTSRRLSRVLSTLAVLFACGDDAAMDDAAMDGETTDAQSMRCTGDEECDDGVFCNGTERCDVNDDAADADGCIAGELPCRADQGCSEAEAACTDACADADGDGVADSACGGADCDDSDENRFPGNAEICNQLDEDCDPRTFGDTDFDGDGFIAAHCCNTNDSGTLFCGEDCDDNDRSTGPNSVEVCDGRDNDCDTDIDEGVALDGFEDSDFDLHGSSANQLVACPGTPGWSPIGDDCDDSENRAFAGRPEELDGIDNDCDGVVDNPRSGQWFRDLDGDGFGSRASGEMSAASQPDGFVALATDCNDDNDTVNPGASELCNGIDDDCNGLADFLVEGAVNDFEDDDHDGAADAACGGTDCDDTNPFVGPDSPELLDGIDNDCNGDADERCEPTNWFVDMDNDGYGNESDSVRSCEPQADRTPRGGDCDDGEAAVNPSAFDICNAIDDDCDENIDETGNVRCIADHALTSCDNDCIIERCELGYTDCDGDNASCETHIREDVDNCGGCGSSFACSQSGPNSRPACREFECTLNCDAGFSDCDDSLSNGCEVRTFDNVLHCGMCDHACPAPINGEPTCDDGMCSAMCANGFDDCNDEIATDGCETEIGLDPNACGDCNTACGAGQTCAIGRCVNLPYPSNESDGDALVITAAMSPVVLASGVHQYRTIVVEDGATLRAAGSGVLELYASESIVVSGTVDVSGGRGGNARLVGQAQGGGGASGTTVIGANTNNCSPGGAGGAGSAGERGEGTTGACGQGGMFGGGAAGNVGGGGGGFGGGGGGGIGTADGGGGGGASGGEGGTANGGPDGMTDTRGGKGGMAPGPYAGADGNVTPGSRGCGGGGSIGAAAATDLEVASTFQPGSGGGGGSGARLSSAAAGGGGGGGALRLAAGRTIIVTVSGQLLANGGRGGNVPNASNGGPGGGGSGGIIFISAPSVEIASGATVSAAPGAGGSRTNAGQCGGDGGLGRIRISVDPRVCVIDGNTVPTTSCDDSTATSGRGYVSAYPD